MTPTRGATALEVQAHYDAGDAFYDLWLDPDRVYSAAMWSPGLDLAAAQQAKLAWHVQEAAVVPGSQVLDIGCGWGAFLERAVRVAGAASAVGLTLSPSQAAAARARGVPGLEVREESWDAHNGTGYDAVVSVGALEHFVRPEFEPEQRLAVYRAFFQACHAALRPGGRLSLQTIAYADFPGGKLDPFITQQIFPGSDLPRLSELAEAHLGTFRLVRMRNDPQDYAKTCTVWAERLASRRAEAEAQVGPERVASFLRYLKMSAAGFRAGALDLLRLTFERR